MSGSHEPAQLKLMHKQNIDEAVFAAIFAEDCSGHVFTELVTDKELPAYLAG